MMKFEPSLLEEGLYAIIGDEILGDVPYVEYVHGKEKYEYYFRMVGSNYYIDPAILSEDAMIQKLKIVETMDIIEVSDLYVDDGELSHEFMYYLRHGIFPD